jgi:hypothetical protein
VPLAINVTKVFERHLLGSFLRLGEARWHNQQGTQGCSGD